ncbi:hypothetical protein PHYBOEH_007595 [Phytophthora boehmeriae]|uniref:Uncharacterized protein n=1 Tax=Phytophthora boehmeriae TaxID=109152 RepID=A0A8T1X7W9_9STRA|nr:hypothetical protein PHYBOEH_007595 [Phytophthora boehmeriae]
MTFALRKQWTAKAASFQRGLEHVQLCTAGDACGSSLCHSTRRLMRTVASHQCPPQQTGDKKHCRVCKLWDFLTAKQQPLPTLQRALALQSCGSAWIQPRRLSAGQRRVLATHKDVTQRRF